MAVRDGQRFTHWKVAVVPQLLKHMEAVHKMCDNHHADDIPVDMLKRHLQTLTAMTQFSTLLAKSNDLMCSW